MESDYVRESVGAALALGLAQVALVRPQDPIEYLGLWLLKHKRNQAEEKEKVLPVGTLFAYILNSSFKVEAVKESLKESEAVLAVSEEQARTEEETKEGGEGGESKQVSDPPESPPTTPPLAPVTSRPDSRLGNKLSRIEEETTETT